MVQNVQSIMIMIGRIFRGAAPIVVMMMRMILVMVLIVIIVVSFLYRIIGIIGSVTETMMLFGTITTLTPSDTQLSLFSL